MPSVSKSDDTKRLRSLCPRHTNLVHFWGCSVATFLLPWSHSTNSRSQIPDSWIPNLLALHLSKRVNRFPQFGKPHASLQVKDPEFYSRIPKHKPIHVSPNQRVRVDTSPSIDLCLRPVTRGRRVSKRVDHILGSFLQEVLTREMSSGLTSDGTSKIVDVQSW